jgi:DNA cross-link repair 1A protein
VYTQYDFPNQETVIQFIIDAIQAEAFNPRTLFLIGTYTIGEFLDVFLLENSIIVGHV